MCERACGKSRTIHQRVEDIGDTSLIKFLIKFIILLVWREAVSDDSLLVLT